MKELDRRIELLNRRHAMLGSIESEIDLIDADLPSASTPPVPIERNSKVS